MNNIDQVSTSTIIYNNVFIIIIEMQTVGLEGCDHYFCDESEATFGFRQFQNFFMMILEAV